MAEKFSLPSWSAKNPLGIIALFISLIYAMSAALLGTSVRNLTEANQTILVVFIAAFPFVVLIVFAWLVARHHSKLYGPADYRTDEGFLSAASPLPPSRLGQRIREEIESQSDRPVVAETAKESADAKPDAGGSAERSVLQAYVAENLAFQELQSEFGGSLRRHISVQAPGTRYQLDGMLALAHETVFVEVKFAYAPSSVAVIARRVRDQFAPLMESNSSRPDIKFLLAVVLNGSISQLKRDEVANKAEAILGERFAVRIYSFGELSRKYGFAKPETRLGKIEAGESTQ